MNNPTNVVRNNGKPTQYDTSYSNWPKGNFTPVYAWERELQLGPATMKKINAVDKKQDSVASKEKDVESGVDGSDALHKHFVWRCFDEYCDNTSLHGLKYITQEEYYWFERIAWALLCASAWVAVYFFVKPTLDRYMTSPMITSIETTSMPVFNVDFPAVTICNINKADKDLVKNMSSDNFWKKYSNKTLKEVIDIMALLSQVVDLDSSASVNSKTIEAIDDNTTIHGINGIDDLMRTVMQPVERMAISCWWLGTVQNCTNIFQRLRTDEGYCWGFNALSMRDLTSEDSFGSLATGKPTTSNAAEKTTTQSSNKATTTVPPPHHKSEIRRVNGAGSNMGLTVLLNPDVKRYYATTNDFFGFKVLVHNPQDFPSVTTKSFLISPGHEVYGAVTATSINSSDNIRNLNKDARDCRFPNEQKLEIYSVYSYQNCIVECQVLSMNRTCGCVPYTYAALRQYNICKYEGLLCLRNYSRKFLSLEAPDDIEGIDRTYEAMGLCKCPSNCDSTDYSTEVSSARFPIYPDDLNIDGAPYGTEVKNLTLLRIFFKDLFFVQYKRDLTYTWDSFVAAFGGIVSLFEGFSLISGVELIYFFTFRPLFRWMRERNKEKATLPH